MGRSRGKRPRIAGGFVSYPWHHLNSKAYRDLPASAAKALPHFLGKPHITYANRMIFEVDFDFSYREARRRFGFSNGTFHRVLTDLMKFGFIDPVEKGGLRGLGRTGSRFKVSKRWEKYGLDDFEEIRWSSFKPRRR